MTRKSKEISSDVLSKSRFHSFYILGVTERAGGGGGRNPPPGRRTPKKPGLNRVKATRTHWHNSTGSKCIICNVQYMLFTLYRELKCFLK